MLMGMHTLAHAAHAAHDVHTADHSPSVVYDGNNAVVSVAASSQQCAQGATTSALRQRSQAYFYPFTQRRGNTHIWWHPPNNCHAPLFQVIPPAQSFSIANSVWPICVGPVCSFTYATKGRLAVSLIGSNRSTIACTAPQPHVHRTGHVARSIAKSRKES